MDPNAQNPNQPPRDWQPQQPTGPAPSYPQNPPASGHSPLGNAFDSNGNWQKPVEPALPTPQPLQSSYPTSPQQPHQQSPQQPGGSYNSDQFAPTQYGSQYSSQPQQHQSQQYSHQQPAPKASSGYGVEERPRKGKGRDLNLSKGEVILSDVRRHPIGVLQIYFVAGFVLLALLFGAGALVRYLNSTPQDGIVGGSAFPFPTSLITGLAFGLAILTVVIATIAIHVYRGNRLFVTNESVIQFVQRSLFDTKQQTIGLGNIEDVSYEQSGVMPHIFHYGTIRLSTEGEETTYYFRYAAHPKEQADKIIDAQEQFNRLHPEHHY